MLAHLRSLTSKPAYRDSSFENMPERDMPQLNQAAVTKKASIMNRPTAHSGRSLFQSSNSQRHRALPYTSIRQCAIYRQFCWTSSNPRSHVKAPDTLAFIYYSKIPQIHLYLSHPALHTTYTDSIQNENRLNWRITTDAKQKYACMSAMM